MTLQEIYELGIRMGIAADPRGKEEVEKILAKRKKEYEELPEKKKKLFDLEELQHPYSDSRLYIGDPKKEIKKVIVGIDAEVGEMVLVDRLNEKGMGIDAVITHHPHGNGLAGIHGVAEMLTDMAVDAGVPVNVADDIITERTAYMQRRFVGVPNHNQTIDAARLLSIPFLSFHTVWDNMGWHFVTDYVAKKESETLGELFDYIGEISEFVEAAKYKAGPMIVAGSRQSKTGKILVEMTGGTNIGKDIFPELAKAGIGTVVQMHITEDEIKEMKKQHIHAIDTGHIPSDSIGANLFLDELESNGVEVIQFGGLIRVKR